MPTFSEEQLDLLRQKYKASFYIEINRTDMTHTVVTCDTDKRWAICDWSRSNRGWDGSGRWASTTRRPFQLEGTVDVYYRAANGHRVACDPPLILSPP